MPNRKKTTLGVVHVTATPPGWKASMKALIAMHKARGFSTVGYNEVIFPDGSFEITPRGADGIGAHVAGFNSIAYGIALVGGVDKNNKPDSSTITDAQWKTLSRRMVENSKKYPAIMWCGHRDLSPDKDGDGIIEPYEWLKACPCFDAIPYAQSLSLKGANIRGTWKAKPPLPGAPVIMFAGPDARNAYLQKLLAKAGFDVGPIDGIIGNTTMKAIGEFQAANGLTLSRMFDAPTVKALRERFETKPKEEPIAALMSSTLLPSSPEAAANRAAIAAIPPAEPAKVEAAIESVPERRNFLGGALRTVLTGALTGAIGGAIGEASMQTSNSLKPQEASQVSEQVIKAAVEATQPVLAEAQSRVDHALNREAWYQSRVTLGAIAAMVAGVAGLAGYTFTAEDQSQVVDMVRTSIELGTAVVALVGGAVAWYGRWRARKPLGE